MTTKTLYFNTGVRPTSYSPLFGRQIWKDGTKQIPFTCEDVPDNAVFMFACAAGNLPESELSTVIVRRILDSGPDGLMSEYAYFRVTA